MWTVVGTIGIVLATVVLGVLADRKWGIVPSAARLRAAGAPKPLPGHAPGEAPATALHMTPAELAGRKGFQHCRACNARMTPPEQSRVLFDGRELHVLAFHCKRCGDTRSVYVEVS